MANMFDYISWRGDLSFSASPFNPVDNIILSQLSYLTLDDIVPDSDGKKGISIELAVRIFDEKLHSPQGLKQTSFFKEDPDLIRALSSSRRFGDCQLFGYVNHVDVNSEIQFSALCVYIGDGTCFIAFRGTDSSVVGWKEDLNMSFKDVIPSQLEAVNYIEKMAPMINGRLRVGGHSKGGNLAIYAAAHCKAGIQQRITEIYSNDAPGFNDRIINSTEYAAIKNRIKSYVPQSSIVGMFFEHGVEDIVIKSSENGLMQHSLYSWEVTHNDLARGDNVTMSSRFVNKTIKDWINGLDNEHREQFIDAIFTILSESEFTSLNELEESWFPILMRIFKSIGSTDENTKKFIRHTFFDLFRSARKNIDTLFKK